MKKSINEKIFLDPSKQLYLYGYSKYFDFFKKMLYTKQLPQCLLLYGSKGLGKATFAYHLANYILSINENNKYDYSNYEINPKNSSFNRIQSNVHPNFFLIGGNNNDENVKIEQIRNLLRFVNRSTFESNLKVVLIDNIENLNLNSSNALLKAIEEPTTNTFFLIIHDNAHKISETIKSRCTQFKIHFSITEKEIIFSKLFNQFSKDLNSPEIKHDFYLNTPGNLIRYISLLDDAKESDCKDTLSNINFFLDKYLSSKNPFLLYFAVTNIEKFYYEILINKTDKLVYENFNLIKILRKIDEMKKFNLNEKNTFFLIKNILRNEEK